MATTSILVGDTAIEYIGLEIQESHDRLMEFYMKRGKRYFFRDEKGKFSFEVGYTPEDLKELKRGESYRLK